MLVAILSFYAIGVLLFITKESSKRGKMRRKLCDMPYRFGSYQGRFIIY